MELNPDHNFLPFRFVGDVVAWLALVLAESAHFEACLVAALGLKHSVGYGRRGRAAKLTKSLRERPQTVGEANKGVVCT